MQNDISTEKKFRIVSRDFFLTYSQCTVSLEDIRDFFRSLLFDKMTYLCIGTEKHKDGNTHFHVQIQTKSDYNLTKAERFWVNGAKGKFLKSDDSARVNTYCQKHGDFYEEGTYEVIYIKKHLDRRSKTKAKNELIISTPLPDLVNSGDISIYNYIGLLNAKNRYLADANPTPSIFPRKCYWIYGEPGIGKSYWVRTNYSEVYSKPLNKWWDGYSNQPTVLLDDFDSSQLGHLLKIWADGYSFNAEVKGGTITPSYSLLFITSNYYPEDLWKDNDMLAKAVRRRFIFTTIKDGDLWDDTLLNRIGKI